MTDIDLLIREFRADQPGPEAAPAAVAEAARAARGPRRRLVRRRLLAGAAVTATIAGAAALLVLALPRGGDDPAPATPSAGYAVRATVRVAAPDGADQDAVMDRAAGILRARAAAQGLTGVVVARSGDATLSLRIPGAAGAERVALLTENPGLGVVDLTGDPDPAAAPVVLAPGDITDLTFIDGFYRVGVRDRAADALSSALARRRELVLMGTAGTGRDPLGRIDIDRSAAMSSSAILAVPLTPAKGSPEHAARTLAGGGLDADFSVEDVRTVGEIPAGVAEIPLEVARGLNVGASDGAAPPMLPGSARLVLTGSLDGRQVAQWEGVDVTGERRSFIVAPGGGGVSVGCPASPPEKDAPSPAMPCAYVRGGDVAAIFGWAGAGVARVEVRWRGASRTALLRDGRFLALLPTTVTPVTIVAIDPAGRELGRETTGVGGGRLFGG